jgi:hypothetical protein
MSRRQNSCFFSQSRKEARNINVINELRNERGGSAGLNWIARQALR